MGFRRREFWCILIVGSLGLLWLLHRAKESQPRQMNRLKQPGGYKEALRKKYWSEHEDGTKVKTKSFIDMLPEYVIDVEPPPRSSGLQEKPLIPHIIHQVWDSNITMPGKVLDWVESWRTNHPEWQYWLWTPVTGRQLISDLYPDYLTLYDSYTEEIFRIDAMRLFMLYTFGGVYVDLDMLSIKPMDAWTYSHDCILTHETYEHSFIVSDKTEPNIVNGFMACRPRHPFFAHAIKSLPQAARDYFGDFLQATGPFFMDRVLKHWRATNKTTDENISHNNRVSVIHPKYFLPTYDPTLDDVISSKCSPHRVDELSDIAKALCQEQWATLFSNIPNNASYADHKWVNFYMYGEQWKHKNAQNITQSLHSTVDVLSMIRRTKVDF